MRADAILPMLLGLLGLVGLAVNLFIGESGKQESNLLGAFFCALIALYGYQKAGVARRTPQSPEPDIHPDATTLSEGIRPPAATNPRTLRALFWLLLVLGVGIHPVWYWNYRMSMHREAPAYFDKLLPALSARWALDDISPFFHEHWLEKSSRESWETRLRCYAQLGRIKSHGRPVSSDLGLFGGVYYMIPVRFENGAATVYVQINKVRGQIGVLQLSVSAENATDSSWCQSFRSSQKKE